MASEAVEVRAPQGAVGWTPTVGYVYDVRDLPDHIEPGHYVLVVSERDGMVHVNGIETAPLSAVLRLETNFVELLTRIDEMDPDDLRMRIIDIHEFASARLSQRREIMWGDRPPNG